MKILHSADLHLDTPFTGRNRDQAQFLQQQLLRVPYLLADLCRKEACDLVLLSGDLFDDPKSRNSFRTLAGALEECQVPVFISPGNHDYVNLNSPYVTEQWPSNVHIFTSPQPNSRLLPELDCRIYGAGYRSMDCGSLLDSFQRKEDAKYHIGVLHGDPTQADSPFCPVTAGQIRDSGLDYLALGHIHQRGGMRQGRTLCAWPGCPMGRGFDETGTKGALIVTLDTTAEAAFVPLDTVRFFDETASASALSRLLPGVSSQDFYRITLTGEGDTPSLSQLYQQYAQLPHLELRDHRTSPVELWGDIQADTLEGTYFRILKDALSGADEDTGEIINLAARISRQLLEGQEVQLP